MKTFIILISTITLTAAQWPPPKAPAVSGADGYVEIPNAALAPTKTSNYRAFLTGGAHLPDRTEMIARIKIGSGTADLSLRIDEQIHGIGGVSKLAFFHSAPHKLASRCNPGFRFLHDLYHSA